MPLGMRPPWACGVGDLAAALAAFSRRITDHGRTLPLRSHGWLAQEMVHPILTRMWKRRHPPSLSKAILVAVNAWRLLHVQVHEAAKKTVIGRRLCVYWKDDSLWYCGIINDYDPKDDKHLVHYDDGVDEWLLLKAHWRVAKNKSQATAVFDTRLKKSELPASSLPAGE